MLFERALADHPNSVELWLECLRYLVRHFMELSKSEIDFSNDMSIVSLFPSRIISVINMHCPRQ
jgi:hypothetical protein